MLRFIKHSFAKGFNVYERFPRRVTTLGEELQLLVIKGFHYFGNHQYIYPIKRVCHINFIRIKCVNVFQMKF